MARSRASVRGAGNAGTIASSYSGKALVEKLGYRDGQRVLFIAMPTEVAELLSEPRYPVREVVATAAAGCLPLGPWDAIHLFATAQAELERALPALRAALVPDGMIWVSWPKKPARVATDVSENTVRAAAHACHMVDLKVCAVDATWSGLKLVIRRADRATGAPPS